MMRGLICEGKQSPTQPLIDVSRAAARHRSNLSLGVNKLALVDRLEVPPRSRPS